MFIVASVTFFAAEAKLPPEYKPSHYLGGYDRVIAQAKAEGELTARIGFEGRLKVIETAASAWQERCKAGLQNYTNYYQAAYNRANAGYQLAASIQQQYTSARFSTTQASLGGEIGVANTATTFGYIIGLFDPESGQKTLDFAEAARQAALRKLDEAARGGVTVTSDGWNAGLPDPAKLPPPVQCDMPSALVAPQPSTEG